MSPVGPGLLLNNTISGYRPFMAREHTRLTSALLQNSRLVPPADGHDTTGQVDPAAHGYGPVEVSLGGFPAGVIDDRVVNTSKLLGGRFSYNQDMNAGDFTGVGKS